MNVMHGCIGRRPIQSPCEKGGPTQAKIAEEGGLVPNPPTGGLIQSQYLNKTEEEHLKI